MAEHSEHFMTEVLDRVAAKFVNESAPDEAIAKIASDGDVWSTLDPYQKQQVKQDLLATVLAVLDAASEVGGNADGSVAFAYGYEAAAEFYTGALADCPDGRHNAGEEHTPADRTEAFYRWKNEIR